LPHVPQSYKLSPPRRCHQHCNICISIKSHSFSYSLHVAQSADPPKPRLHEHVVFTQPQACVFFACSAVLQAQPAMPPPPALQYLHKDDMPFSFIALLVAQSADPPKLSVMPLPLLRRSSRNARLHSARTHTHTYTHTHTHTHMLRSQQTSPKPSAMPLPLLQRSSRNARLHSARANTHTHTHIHIHTCCAVSRLLPSLVPCRYHCCGAGAGTHDCSVRAHTHTHTHTCCAVSRPLPSPAPCRYHSCGARARTHDCSVRAHCC
jgi:hypothetical protein